MKDYIKKYNDYIYNERLYRYRHIDIGIQIYIDIYKMKAKIMTAFHHSVLCKSANYFILNT